MTGLFTLQPAAPPPVRQAKQPRRRSNMGRPTTSHTPSHTRSFSMLRRPRTAAQSSNDLGAFLDTSAKEDVPHTSDWPLPFRLSPTSPWRRQHQGQQKLGHRVLSRQKSFSGLGVSPETLSQPVLARDESTESWRLSGVLHHKSHEDMGDVEHMHLPRIKPSASSKWLQRALKGRRRANTSEPSHVSSTEGGSSTELQPNPGGLAVPLRGGEAARAAAAASNERLDNQVHTQPREIARRKDGCKSSDDNESGIGIDILEITTPSSEPELEKVGAVARIDPASLPEELFYHILTYLDAASIMAAELVSRRWRETAGSRHTWRNIFAQEVQEPVAMAAVAGKETGSAIGGRGIGQGSRTDQQWKRMWQARHALEARWQDGHAAAIYLEGHSDSVYCVQFDEEKIVTGSRDRTVRVWDLHTFECLRVLGIPKSSTTSPIDGGSFPLPGSRMNGQRPFASVTPPVAKCVSPRPQTNEMNHFGSILCLQFDATTMVTGSSDTTLLIWDITDDWTPKQRLSRHRAGVLDVCFDASHIVSCSRDTTICLWDRESGDLLSRFTGHLGPVNAVQLRGEHFVSASGDGMAKLWHLGSGLCVKEFPSKDRGLACVEFSPDGRTILTGGNDQVIYQFDANTGELVKELVGHSKLVRSLHLDAAHGRVISGSYDYSVKVFDLGTDRDPARLLCDFQGWTTSWMLSAMADYRRIVATSQDGRVVVMDFGHGLRDVELLEGRQREPGDAWFS